MMVRFNIRPDIGSKPTTPRLCELNVGHLELRVSAAGALPLQQQIGVERGSVGNGFVGRDRLVDDPARQFSKHLLDHRHSRRTADHQYLVDFAPGQAGLHHDDFRRHLGPHD
jgi:hypothetical protein